MSFPPLTATQIKELNRHGPPNGMGDRWAALERARTVIDGNHQTDDYTLVLQDAGLVIELDKASAVNLTVPAEADVDFEVGTVIEVWQQGAGQVTIVPDSGVTLRSAGDLVALSAQYASATLRKVGADEWALVGSLA
jgi:hypothetical protein